VTHSHDPHATPPVRGVFLTQLRIIGSGRNVGLLGLALIACYAVASAGIVGFDMAAAPSVIRAYPLLLVASVSWALVVWQDAGPSRRDYFWAMPVDRVTHALLRTTAGAVWLVGGIAALALVSAAIDAATSSQALAASNLAWVSLFSGPLTLYFLVSAVAIVSAFPGRWAIAVLIVWSFLHRACASSGICGPELAGRSALGDQLGLTSAVTEVMRTEFVTGGPSAQPVLKVLIAAWLVLAVAAVALAARRRPSI
jgi:hypothetical protein